MIGTIALFLVILLSAAAGIGGGGNIIPVLLILYRFSSSLSIALSNFNIFISSLLRYIINFNVRHPLKDAVLIDYEIVMLMMPTTLMGSIVGMQFNQVLPDVVILILLTIVLIFMGYKTLKQSITLY